MITNLQTNAISMGAMPSTMRSHSRVLDGAAMLFLLLAIEAIDRQLVLSQVEGARRNGRFADHNDPRGINTRSCLHKENVIIAEAFQHGGRLALLEGIPDGGAEPDG